MKFVVVILFSYFGISAFANQFEDTRQLFANSVAPYAEELNGTKWTCANHFVDQLFPDSELSLFEFYSAFENPSMLYTRLENLPIWFPAWFASYQGLRTSIAMKLGDFVTAPCHDNWLNCVESGSQLQSYAYIRRMPGDYDHIYVEWTAEQRPYLNIDAISIDSEVGSTQRVYMYSACHLEI